MGKDKLSKVYVGQINKQATEDELRKFIFDTGINESQITGIWLKRGYAFIECLDQATADSLIDQLNGTEFQGQRLNVQPSVANPASGGSMMNCLRSRLTGVVESTKASDSLKLLIPSEFIGAIIGRGGNNIKELTVSTGARINILRNRPIACQPPAEKVVCITGTASQCTSACSRILEICMEEASASSTLSPGSPADALKQIPEVSLKMLANNAYIGKIIGKDGRNIKKIMQETGTKIHVSNQLQGEHLETPAAMLGTLPDLERIITIRGSLEGMCRAETMISSKLRAHPAAAADAMMLSNLAGASAFWPAAASFYPGALPIAAVPHQWGQHLTKLQTISVNGARHRLAQNCYKFKPCVY